MSINLVRNFSFENALTGWSTSGAVSPEAETFAFHLATVARLGGLEAVDNAILSQLILVPDDATHFHVVYAVRPELISEGDLEVQVEFRGSANLDPPLPLLRVDVIDEINEGALVDLSWQTRYAVTGEIPPDTEWARLRFIHRAPFLGEIYIDAVYMTTD